MLLRQQLMTRLGRTPLTVIRAPGGSGKTVLMAQWAGRRAGAGAWITVEADVGERPAFWAAVAAAVAPAQAAPEAGRAEVARLLRAVGTPFTLLIDDAHELRDPAIGDDLVALVHGSPNLTLVVGTRTHTELEAPRHALTVDITLLEPHDLQLTAAEVQRIVGPDARTVGTAEELLDASGGNPLLLRAIVAGSSAGVRPGITAHEVVRDYLHALFERGGDHLQALAAATSVPDDVDLAEAEHLTGLDQDGIRDLFDGFEADGILMRMDAPDGPRYRYHPLVREALRASFRHDHAERYRRACLVASADAEVRRDYLAALRLAVEAEDYSRASDVVLHGGFSLLRSRGAAAILERVPPRHVARLPFLAVVLGLAANARGERLRAVQLLTLALAASRAGRGRQRVAERIGLALVESTILRITGRAADSVAAARRMLALLDEAAPIDLEELGTQEGAYRHQGALSLFRAGRLLEARAVAERAGVSPHALAAGSPDTLGLASLVAVIDAARGDMPAARRMLSAIDAAPFPPELRDRYLGSLAHLAQGISALEGGDPDSALEHAQVFRGAENLEHGMLFAALRAAAELWRGAPELGLRTLEQREESDRTRARLSAQDRRVLAAGRVLLHAALGQTGPARSALREFDRTDPLGIVLQATLLVQQKAPELTIARLSALPPDAGPRLQASAELLTAAAALLRGDETLAAASVRRFLATSAVHGLTTPVLLVPADQREALWRFAGTVDPDAVAALGRLPAPLPGSVARVALTPREEEVLRQLRETSSVPEIADRLSVSANTVKTQVRTLYRKLEVSNRDEALRVAVLQDLFRD
jgi:LuxR family maltose regulon positive regulatory protein